MTLTLSVGPMVADLSRPVDIAIPVGFDGPQVSAFGTGPATASPYQTGGFIGSVREGGSCNCDVYHFSPHLHGTHTEGVGHLTGERLSIHTLTTGALVPATLITLQPTPAGDVPDESYTPSLRTDDPVLTAKALLAALEKANPAFLTALVIRTLPNGAEKAHRHYGDSVPPFFTHHAVQVLLDCQVQHLLVDLPSVDRVDDDGMLSNHRLFWQVPMGQTHVERPSAKTITELIYVPDAVSDGPYILNLQVAAFVADAAPSRPVLYPVSDKASL